MGLRRGVVVSKLSSHTCCTEFDPHRITRLSPYTSVTNYEFYFIKSFNKLQKEGKNHRMHIRIEDNIFLVLI